MEREDPGPRSAGRPLPHCKAMLLCEEVTENPDSGAMSLRNLINAFQLSAFPGESGPFAIYLQLYDGIGRYRLTIEASDLADDTMVARAPLPDLDFPDRLARIEMVIPVDSVRLPRAGRYDLVVFADGQELSRQYFEAGLNDV